jgi:HAD superfamily hydrolase (TIGR01459 family)
MNLMTENPMRLDSYATNSASASTNCQSSTSTISFQRGLSTVAEQYDTFLIDQWGVLHDGRKPYPGAVRCLHHLVEAGKQVILVSNSGRRALENEHRLNRLGFPKDSYSLSLTSGEIAWQMLAAGQGQFRKLVGTRCLLLSSNDPLEFAEGLPIVLAEADEADFILLAGIDDTKPPHYYEQMIASGLRRGLPLICANPDLMRITPAGLKPGAGAIADRYEAGGGTVNYIGKPYPEIYAHCLMLAAAPKERVLAIGDSLHHDIAGGRAAGIDTLLVMCGVHADELPENADPAFLRAAIVGIAGHHGAIPDWAVPSLRW